jgi:pyruvate dehydrogenase E2 component (dihydrolipoamide acetyltransferase)
MTDFKFADIGEGIHEGVILKWFFEVGDTVKEGDTLVIIETDKVNAEIPSPEAGVILKRGPEVGETVHVGDTLALIGEKGDSVDAPKTEAPKEPVKEEAPKETSKADSGASVVGSVEVSDAEIPASKEYKASQAAAAASSSSKVLATPVARKMAKDLGVDLASLNGSGPNGRVMKADIQNAKGSAPQSVSAPSVQASMPAFKGERTHREKITPLRKAIVKAMNVSNQVIPATTLIDTFEVDELVKLRTTLKPVAAEQNQKLTYLPLLIKASILALKKYPQFNASFDHNTEEMVYKNYFNLGLAVDTEAGLVVPNIKDADLKSIFELASEVDRLAGLARDRKLALADIQDTTFSITNFGAFGIDGGTPVINHPEVAILGMGAIKERAWVKDGVLGAHSTITLSLTVDHRVIDGGDAGRFILEVKRYLQNPMLLLLA